LAGVGTPLLVVVLLLDGFGAGLGGGGDGFGLGFGFAFGAGFGLELGFGLLDPEGGVLWCEGGCVVPVLVVLGGGCCCVEVVWVGVVVEVVGVELVPVVDVDVVGVDVVGVEVVVEVVPEEGAHDTLSSCVPGGGWTAAADGEFTVSCFNWPVASTLTITVHTSADAAGICAITIRTETTAVVTPTARSLPLQGATATHLGFRRFNKLGLSSRRVPSQLFRAATKWRRHQDATE
jgi:hypothetical protein